MELVHEHMDIRGYENAYYWQYYKQKQQRTQ